MPFTGLAKVRLCWEIDGKETNEDIKKQGWPAVSAARENYKKNSKDAKWKKSLEKKVKEFKAKDK